MSLNPGSNPFVAVSKFSQFHSLHVATVNSAVLMTEVDMRTPSLRTVIAAWLNAFQINRDGVGMKSSARGEV